MKRALIIDTETTGLDPAKDRVIEVGCILYDLEVGSPIASFSSLIQGEGNAAVGVNRIAESLLADAPDGETVWRSVDFFAGLADVFMAHRAEFDRGFVPFGLATRLPWVCTKFHCEWPMAKNGEHLAHLALAHGVGVVSAHRALTDCDILARLLTRVHETGHSLVRMVERAMRPRLKLQAIVSYDDREKAKNAGFHWDPAARGWFREVVADDAESFPFETRQV